MFIWFQTEIHVKPRASHKQNYDHGGSPPAELRLGRLSTSRIVTRELPYYPQAELRPGSWHITSHHFSSVHHIISLGTACGDSVFCGSGTASGDSCQFFSFRLLMSLGTASGDSVFCSVTYFCESSGAASGDPFVPFDFIASFLWAPPVATQFSVVRAPPVATLGISCHRIISVGTAWGDLVFFSVIQCVVCSGTISGNSFMSFEFMASFVWAPRVATQFSVLS